MKNLTLASLVASSALAVSLGVSGMTSANAVAVGTTADSSTQAIPFASSDVKRGEWSGNPDGKRGGHRGEHGGGGGMHRAMDKLDLTEAQQAKIDAIMDAKKAGWEANRTSKQAKREQEHEQMQALMNQTTLNQAQVNRLANAHAEEAKQRFIDRIETQHAIAQVLTSGQRAELEAMHEARSEGRGGRF